MIVVEELSKSFGATRAVDSISFQVRRGEVVGFLGPNGAGKTTTMRLLTGYLVPDSGRIRIDGRDVEEESLSVRKNVGYLPESAPLYHDLSVMEYLEYVAAIRKIPRWARPGRIAEMVSTCGLEEVVRKRVGVLSKGYRQRVGLAQTMIHGPDVLVLDEPTSGLDPNQIAEIRELIRRIGRERTIIISTHILSEVTATCGRVLIINRGRIVADGSPGELSDRLQGRSACFVSLKGSKEAIQSAFSDAPIVARFEERGDSEGLAHYWIQGTVSGNDLAEALFHLAVERGFALVELRRERASLEEVFASLTLREARS